MQLHQLGVLKGRQSMVLPQCEKEAWLQEAPEEGVGWKSHPSARQLCTTGQVWGLAEETLRYCWY